MPSITSFIKHHYRHFNAAALVDAANGYNDLLDSGGKMFVTIGVWTDEDSAFIARLARLRNGIAHNNAESLSRALGGRAFPHINDARLAVAEIDVLPYVMSTIVALQKLATALR